MQAVTEQSLLEAGQEFVTAEPRRGNSLSPTEYLCVCGTHILSTLFPFQHDVALLSLVSANDTHIKWLACLNCSTTSTGVLLLE